MQNSSGTRQQQDGEYEQREKEKKGHINPPSQLNQDHLHGVLALPLGQAGQLPRIDDAILGVDAGEVDLADELDGGGLVGVFLAAVHFEAVDAVFVGRLQSYWRLAFPDLHVELKDSSVLSSRTSTPRG